MKVDIRRQGKEASMGELQLTAVDLEADRPANGVLNRAYHDDEQPTRGENSSGTCSFSDSCHPDEETVDIEEDTKCTAFVEKVQDAMTSFWDQYGTVIKWIFYGLLIAGYFTYFGFAMSYKFGDEESVRLLWMTCLVLFCSAYPVIKKRYGHNISKNLIDPLVNFVENRWCIFKWGFIFLVVALFTSYIVIGVALQHPHNLISLCGYVIFITLFFIFSSNPARVKWQPVCWGLGLQVVFAFLVLRTSAGYVAFQWLGDRVREFLEYSDAGAKFVFGESFVDHFFAMKVMPVVVFFSTMISVLYYLGIMQMVIHKIAWIMTKTMGTTPAESVNAAGNIFIGITEAPLLIRPLIPKMTKSELHAVMTGGYATIAGSVLASYILFGVPANHLLTASVMAAPCALAMSKLFYPETETAQSTEDIEQMEPPPYTNVIEAASAGACAAVGLVANIVVNIMAFISILAFINTTLTWFGDRVGAAEPLTFQVLCSYVMWPLALLMGVEPADCGKVGELIGTKLFVNEFVAYTELAKIINNTDVLSNYNGTMAQLNRTALYLNDTDTILIGGTMEERSIVISTYALCGFANFGSIGMVMGGLGSMIPEKMGLISKLAVRAMIAGAVTSFMNACIAGLLYGL